MSTLEIIEEKVDLYKLLQSVIVQRRKVWNRRIRDMVYEIFSDIAGKFEIGWHSSKNELIQNLQSVQLNFGLTRSGIIKKGQMIVKVGGHLTYAQSINGKIVASISYPYLKEFGREMRTKKLNVYEPEEITETNVYEDVAFFLSEMTEWENA